MAPFCKTIRSPRLLTPTLHLILPWFYWCSSVWVKFCTVLSPCGFVCSPLYREVTFLASQGCPCCPSSPGAPRIILTITTNPSLFQKWLHSPNIIQVESYTMKPLALALLTQLYFPAGSCRWLASVLSLYIAEWYSTVWHACCVHWRTAGLILPLTRLLWTLMCWFSVKPHFHFSGINAPRVRLLSTQ